MPGKLPPKPRCVAASATIGVGFCAGTQINFRTCSSSIEAMKTRVQYIQNDVAGVLPTDPRVCSNWTKKLCSSLGGTPKPDACTKSNICGSPSPLSYPVMGEETTPAYTVWNQCSSDFDCNYEETLPFAPPSGICCSEIQSRLANVCTGMKEAALALYVNGTQCSQAPWCISLNPPQPSCQVVQALPSSGYCGGRSVEYSVCAENQRAADFINDFVVQDLNRLTERVRDSCEFATATACEAWVGGQSKAGTCHHDAICSVATVTSLV
eukprot:CAMPEP_0113684164 /NCGR_PEP_ID=MMETSP0038_2-20120614/13810_1 /TAXON_ID=2898 /ORGANISM="Cryptomonas paramecium" /LENGTH=266 /DNA_ID=CAMNT_0000603801 /DNA_START=357 /DNA_END=1154 /DNA_ORIENTATION=+ /assembly_acc=CAM_ASM_000170